jgi:hypothetical protein
MQATVILDTAAVKAFHGFETVANPALNTEESVDVSS